MMDDTSHTQQDLDGEDTLAVMLRPVRLAFLQSLTAHVPVFERIGCIPVEHWKDEEIQDLVHRTHKIAGVSSTLGYTRLGQLAAGLEAALRQRQHDGSLSSAVGEAISEMKALIASSASIAAE